MSTILHVVYAGRGDAFYLEYTYVNPTSGHKEHMLVCLDGGPLRVVANGYSEGPYYKYYLAAGRHIWQNAFQESDNSLPFAPTAIINSHPHDDHLDGLVQLMMTGLANSQIQLTGPFVLPAISCPGRNQVNSMALKLGLQYSAGCTVKDTIGINFFHPSPDQNLVSFFKPLAQDSSLLQTQMTLLDEDEPPVIQLPKQITIDASSENLASILMQTDPDATAGKGCMFFTGDNVGDLIWECVDGKHFTVYKIQHHGSLRNTQFYNPMATVYEAVGQETALYIFMAYIIDRDPNVLRLNPPFAPAEGDVEAFLQECFQLNFEEIKQYYKLLKRRNEDYLTQCAHGQGTGSDPIQASPWSKTWDSPSEVWARLVAMIKSSNPKGPAASGMSSFFYEWPCLDPPRRIPLRRWTSALLNVTASKDNLKALLLTGSILKFFMSFTADAYVISANKTYSHPSSATIAGLAIAVHIRALPSPVPLYVTDGYSVDTRDISAYITVLGYNPQEVFSGKFLVIQCLTGSIYMSINGNGGDVANRDIRGVTTTLSSNQDVIEKLAKANAEYNSTDKTIQDRIIAASTWQHYQITSPMTPAYLTIDQSTKLVQLVDTAPTTSFIAYNHAQLFVRDYEDFQVVQMYSEPLEANLRFTNMEILNGMTYFEIGYLDSTGNWVRSYLDHSSGKEVHKQVAWGAPLPKAGSAIPFSMAPVKSTSMMMAVEFEQNSDITRAQSLEDSSTQGSSVVTSQAQLNNYYQACDMLIPSDITSSQALQDLIGIDNFAALSPQLDEEEAIFQLHIDPISSSVAFNDYGLNVQVSLATLIVLPPSSGTILIQGKDTSMTGATITLKWSTLTDISLAITITEAGTPVTITKTVNTASASPVNLRKALTAMGVESSGLSSLSAARIVGYLVADPVGLFKLLSERVPGSILMAGLFGMAIVKEARIVCITTNSDTWKPSLALDGMDIELGEIGFLVENTLLCTQSIAIYGTTVLSVHGKESIKLTLSCDLNNQGSVEATFALSGNESLDTLSGAIGSNGLMTATVPFSGSSLSDLSQISEIALTFTQSSKHTAHYMLSKISASTSFDDWKNYLPSEFPLKSISQITNLGVSLEILSPLLPEQRVVGAIVALELQIDSGNSSKQSLDIQFSAHPLGAFGSYDYRLSAHTPASGLSIADIASGMGVDGVVDSLTAAGSLFAQLLEDVHIQSFSVAIEETNKLYTFTDWSLKLIVDELEIVEDILFLTDVAMDLQFIGAYVTGDLAGTLQIDSSLLDCTLRLPTKAVPGILTINNLSNMTVASLVSALNLSSLDSVPVVKDLLSTQLDSAHYTIGYVPTPGQNGKSTITCLGYSFTLELDSLTFTGSISVEELLVSVGWHSENDPYGPGVEQLVFSVKAALLNKSLVAQIIYDSTSSDITFTLTTPDPENPAKISDLLGELLGSSFAYALGPLIGNTAVQGATLALSTSRGVELQHFIIKMVDPADTQFQGLPMTLLSVEYKAATKAQGSVPAVIESLVLHATIKKDTIEVPLMISCIEADTTNTGNSSNSSNSTQVSFSLTPEGLTIASLNELFGTSTPSYQTPDGCSDFSSVAVKSVQGQVSVEPDSKSGSASLSLESFQAIFEQSTHIDILKSPAVTLESLSLCIKYQQGTTSGNVFGHLIISTADIWVTYCKDSAGNDTFMGNLTLHEGQTPVTFDTLAATFLSSSDDYSISSALGAPSEIPLSEFDAKLVTGQSIEISGTGQAMFSPQASGYSLSMSNIGGRIAITESSGTAVCSAFLIGQLQFDNWSCVEAVISIGSGHTLLTAELTNSYATVEFSTITKSLSADGSDVTSVSPKGTADISFNKSASLLINFDPNLSQILFFGQLEALAGTAGMILGQWVPSGTASQREYLVSLATQDLGQIWSDLKDTVLCNFDFTTAGAQILSWKDNVSSLSQALSSFEAVATSNNATIADVASLLKILPQDTSVPIGGAIFATISLAGSSHISQGLSLSCETSRQEPSLRFYAFLSPGNSTTSDKSVFKVALEDFYLLGGELLFIGTSTYTPGEQSFTANGSMTLTLSPTSSVTLQMQLSVSENVTKFQLQDQTPGAETLVNPFGGMFNLQLGDIDMSGTITKSESGGQSQASASYNLSGSVYLGTGNLRSDLQGSIIFDQGKAVLARLDLILGQAGLSILDVFSEIIQPGDASSGSWPSAYGDLTLNSASIYYAPQQIQQGMQIYQAGYHISAVVTIFGEPFSITVDLGNRRGISITGQMLDALNLDFITFTNPLLDPALSPPPVTTGPILTIDTTSEQPVYQVNAGVQLFDLPQINATLQYKAETFTGTLTYSGTTLGISDPSLTVVYANDQWSLEILQDMQSKIDLAKQICVASEKDPGCCGKMVGLLFDKTVKTKFHFSLGRPSVKGQEFCFDITWSYDISVVIPDKDPLEITDISLPSIQFTVSPLPDSLDDLGQLMENFILQNVASAGAALLDPSNSSEFAELIGAMAAKSWSKDILEKLLCRKAKQDNVEEQAEDESKSDQDDMKSSDNPGNKSIDASNNTTNSTDLASAVDFLSQAINFAQQFASFLTGVISFLDKALELFTGNSTFLGYSTAAKKQEANVQSHLKKAQDFMGNVLNLSTSSPGPPANFVSTDKTGCEVEVDWSAYLPDTSGFDYDNFSNVFWEVKIGIVNDVEDVSLHHLTISPGTYTASYSDPSFAFASNVYSFIKASVTCSDQQNITSANWTSAQPATHAPWLQPVDNVSFQVSQTNIYNCLVTAASCSVGSFHIEVVSDDPASPATLYQTDISLESAGDISLTIAIFDFKVPSSTVTSCIARIKAISSNSATSHDSVYTSSQALTMAAAPTNLQASYSSSSVTVIWDQDGTGTNDFDVFVIVADGQVDSSVIVTQETAIEGQRQVSLTGTSIVKGATLNIAVRTKPASSSVIGLFVFEVLNIPTLPVPTIDPTTYYNVGNGLPHFTGTTGTMTLEIDMSLACQTPKITVSSLDTSTSETGPPSEPWQFPTIPSSPFTSAPSATFTSDGSLEVTWSWITAMAATAQQVTLVIAGQQKPSPITSIIQSPTTNATFTMTEAKSLFTPGQTVTIQCTPIAVGLLGSPLTTTFCIPASTGCMPFSQNTSTLIAPLCTMTSVAAAGMVPMQVWWGTLKGAIETVEFPIRSWLDTAKQQSAQLANPSTVARTGSCLASTYRSPKDKEVWWITPTGAIDGLRYDGQGWKPPGTGAGEPYPFNKPGTASTTRGGSMTCLSAGNGETALWWVSPTGAIGCAKWTNGSGWGTAIDAAPSYTASFTSVTTQLTTQLASGSPHLFCVSPEGEVVDIHWTNLSSIGSGPMFKNVIAPTASAAPGGGLVSLNMGAKIALFWTTLQNNIEMVILFPASEYGWNTQQYTLTVAGSILQGTGIAAYLMEANLGSVWWIGQFGDLRRIEVDFTKLTPNAISDWPVFEELGPGSCKPTRTLMAQRGAENHIEVFYVNTHGAVAGLSYGN
ncbi:hypothetical protein FBEOM_13525 [Fusarium beomiforme]|uniref:Uncharacterized protein n=1 Tax=Fusarium beomiforme TaxID=44412 RepID=A0A9P5A6K9_9HYPO|nr:hypothetical protein FBEOM_13525 [Fusarium beomiforme]